MIDRDISTLTDIPICGHGECDTMYHPEIGYVTVCAAAGDVLETQDVCGRCGRAAYETEYVTHRGALIAWGPVCVDCADLDELL